MNIDIKQLEETLLSLYTHCISHGDDTPCWGCPIYDNSDNECRLNYPPCNWDIPSIIGDIQEYAVEE